MKLLMLLAARDGVAASFDEAVRAEAQRLSGAAAAASVTALRQVPDDPFASSAPGMRPFDAAVEVRADTIDANALVAGADGRFEAMAHADMCAVVVGAEHVVLAPPATSSVRYQYCMRRRANFSRDAYLDYYVHKHARYGLLPGVDGYTQLHVDQQASRSAAAAAGFGVWSFDSVSELYLDSLDGFLAAMGEQQDVVAAAVEDSAKFVDVRNSVSSASTVLWRSAS